MLVPFLQVNIVRFVNECQPGIVACEFVDANGVIRTIIEKVPIFTADSLDQYSAYPHRGEVRCEVLRSFEDVTGRSLVQVSLARPDGLETSEGFTEHVVFAKAVLLGATND